MKKTINGLQDNEEITAIIRIRKNPDTQHVLTRCVKYGYYQGR
jgi:hypothetical protein